MQELKAGALSTYEIAPEDFGLSRCSLEQIKTGTPEENADMVRGVFSGKLTGPHRDAVVLNAAGALMIGDKADTFQQGIALANELIESGAALQKLQQLQQASHSV